MATSSRSRSSCRSALSITRVTSALFRDGRVVVPAKMTSSILPVRSVLVDWVPRTQARASTRFDLPDPFGPTMTVTPERYSRRVLSANDLKPASLSDFRYTADYLANNTTVIIESGYQSHNRVPWTTVTVVGLTDLISPDSAG